jgi:hypothetical protein
MQFWLKQSQIERNLIHMGCSPDDTASVKPFKYSLCLFAANVPRLSVSEKRDLAML